MKKILIILLFVALFQNSFAKNKVFSSFFGVAINGYDTVAYFLEANHVEGKKEFVYEWEGEKWRFSNQKNLKLFQNNPKKYAPQYGGFCAYAMAQGSFASTSPDAWSIVDGQLFLNYDLQIREKWNTNKNYFISFANKHWADLWN